MPAGDDNAFIFGLGFLVSKKIRYPLHTYRARCDGLGILIVVTGLGAAGVVFVFVS
jgi:hypothetical protein